MNVSIVKQRRSDLIEVENSSRIVRSISFDKFTSTHCTKEEGKVHVTCCEHRITVTQNHRTKKILAVLGVFTSVVCTSDDSSEITKSKVSTTTVGL